MEPRRDSELLVTKKILDLTKIELKSEITSLRMEMKAGFTRIDTEMKTGFTRVDSDIAEIKLNLNKVITLVEEQNERNKVVLSSYGLVYDKLKNHDARLQTLKTRVLAIVQE